MSWIAAAFVVLGAFLAFAGALGLLRMRTFYERTHPPTMGTTLGTGLVLIASILHFTALEGRPVLHEILIGVLMTFTTPITYTLLLRAARRREPGAASGQQPSD
jgi:multicomponent K+:H+ antiporter subunit G